MHAPDTPAPPPDPARCPACGQPNRCALASGQDADHCWCMRLPPLSAPALACGRACLCSVCAQHRLAPAHG